MGTLRRIATAARKAKAKAKAIFRRIEFSRCILARRHKKAKAEKARAKAKPDFKAVVGIAVPLGTALADARPRRQHQP